MIPQQAGHHKLGDFDEEEETTGTAAIAGPSRPKKKKTAKPTLKTTYRRDELFRDQFHLFLALAYVPCADVKAVYEELRAMKDLHPKLKKYLDNYFKPTWICNSSGNSGRYSVESWNVHEM